MRKTGKAGGIAGQILAGQSSSSAVVRLVLDEPCRFFGLQVVTATSSAAVTLSGSIATSSDATLTSLIAWSSDTSGSILSTESTAPIMQIGATVVDSSSAEGVAAWFSASP